MNIPVIGYIIKVGDNRDMKNNAVKTSTIVILISILILGTFLRLYDLGHESIWLDEGFSEGIAIRDVGAIVEWSKNDVHPPLYLVMLHYWMSWFGNSEFSLRLLSALFGILSIIVIYLIGKKCFNNKIGLLSAFLFTISLMHIQYSQEARSYTLLVFLGLISIYYFQNILEHNRIKDWALYLVVSSILIYTHTFAIFIFMFENMYFIYHLLMNVEQKKGKLFLKWLGGQVLIVASFLPWILILLAQVKLKVSGESAANWIPVPNLYSLKSTLEAFSNTGIIAILFTLFILAGFIFFLLNKKNLSNSDISTNWNSLVFNLLWLFSGVLIPFIISIIVSPIYVTRYTMIALPAFYILVAWSVSQINIKFNRPIFVVIALVLSASSLINYYRFIDKEQWREAIQFLQEHEQSNDIIILNAPWTIETFNYYYSGKLKYSIYPAGNVSDLSESISSHPRIWLFQAYENVTDPDGTIKSELLKFSKIRIHKNFVGDLGRHPKAPQIQELKVSCFTPWGTSFYANYDTDTPAANGKIPVVKEGVQYEPGKVNSCMVIDENDKFKYSNSGIINSHSGTLQFWFKPAWNGTDGNKHIIFTGYGTAWNNNTFYIEKSDNGELKAMTWVDGNFGDIVSTSVQHWQAGKWYFITLTWSSSNLELFINGQLKAKDFVEHPFTTKFSSIYVGTDQDYKFPAEGIFDELKIFDEVKTGEQIAQNYTGQKAETGNLLFVQAFELAMSNGSTSKIQNINYQPGKIGKGILITQGSHFSISNTSIINPYAGKIEFWFKPNWAGNDGAKHLLLTVFGAEWNKNSFYIEKADNGNLQVTTWVDGAVGDWVGTSASNWQPGEWHFIEFSWDPMQIELSIDHQSVSIDQTSKTFNGDFSAIFVGTDGGFQFQANGSFDELKIQN